MPLSGKAPPQDLRLARSDDLPTLLECLAGAFFEDPVWGLWSFPDPETRAAGLSRLLGFWARAGIRHEWSWLAGPEGTVQAGTVWIPPGRSETTSEDDAIFGPLIEELYGPRAPAAKALFESFEENHPQDEPHYYLSLLGTGREHAGRGIGMSLMRANLARIDGEHRPAYLESSNAANVARYESLGFRPRSRFGPPGGPVITTMWRPAR